MTVVVRKAYWIPALATLIAAAAISISIASDSLPIRVSTGGDPYEVSAKRLRHELEATGIAIRFIPQKTIRLVESVVGVGRVGRAEIGFEFRLYPSSDRASVRQMGRLKARQFDWRDPRRISGMDVKLRGVLANVAYAQYSPISEVRESTQAYLQLDAQHRRVLRALDDALFGSFPRSDPYAYPLSATP